MLLDCPVLWKFASFHSCQAPLLLSTFSLAVWNNCLFLRWDFESTFFSTDSFVQMCCYLPDVGMEVVDVVGATF